MKRGRHADGHDNPSDESIRRGLERFIEARRARGVPESGYIIVSLDACPEGCTLHDHDA